MMHGQKTIKLCWRVFQIICYSSVICYIYNDPKRVLFWHQTLLMEGTIPDTGSTRLAMHTIESIYRRVAQCIFNRLSKVCVTRREAQSNDDILQCRMSPHCAEVTINPTGMTVSQRNMLLCNLNSTDPYLSQKRDGVLTEATMKNTVFWNVTPCSFVNMYQQLGVDRQG
jgi:hypothetical protein